jgi:dTDP-4-amino-4,6-dideoxygalactose transaminase
LNGRAVDMKALRALAKKRKLALVEDACQAMFSRSPLGYLGTLSDAGCFSLGVTKLISTGQGGMVVTRDRRVYERLKLVRNHGVADTFQADYTMRGFNFKFTDLQAAVGLVQLGRVKARLAHAKALYKEYAAAIAGLGFMKTVPVNVAGGEVPLYFEALCDDRDGLRKFLADRGIQTRPFLPDLDRSPHLVRPGHFPHSRLFSGHGVFLPAGPSQSLQDVRRVIEALRLYGRRR